MTNPNDTVRRSRAGREYGLTILVLLLGAIGTVVSYGATWITAVVPVFEGETMPTTQVTFTGQSLIGFGGAAGWVALAAVAGVVATRTWGRVFIGAVAVLAGGVSGVAGFTFIFSRGALVTQALDGGTALSVDSNAWWVVAVVSGLAVVVAGVVTIARGRGWSALGQRYERAGGSAVTHGQAATAAQTWDALDQGEDPTQDDKD